MTRIFAVSLVCLGTCVLAATTGSIDELLSFDEWLVKHSKKYSTVTEHERRRSIFDHNALLVQQHNDAYEAGLTSYTMTLQGPFADLTADEFSTQYLMDPQDCSATSHPSSGKLTTHSTAQEDYEVDWRTKGIMTPIKNQGHCGSCWTFSTTGCLEAHTCLAAGKDCTHWKGLAEQQLVDCAGDYNNHGCNGGLPSQAYEYIKYNGGLDFEESYTYVANETDGICKAASNKIGAKVAEVYNITTRDEDDLVHAIATLGPVSIAYQVSPDFRFYQHGVYDSYNATTGKVMCNNTNYDVNHAVVAVGLGQTAVSDKHPVSIPYYVVRNSWGTTFGMEGHFWMKRGENLCGVSDCASFPLVPLQTEDDDDHDDEDNGTTTGNGSTTEGVLLLRGASATTRH